MTAIPVSAAQRDGAEWSNNATVTCWHCRATHDGQYFCPACEAIQAFPEHADYFQILGLPRTPVIDTELLQRRYYELHRKLHPDLFQTGAPEARQASLRNTAAVNQAFRTLRDPEDRGLYWLTLHGEALGTNNNRVPPELAELVFEVQEKLEELQAGGAGQREEIIQIRQQLEERRAALDAALTANFEAWDRQGGNAALGVQATSPTELLLNLKTVLSKLAYLSTLMRDVDKALEQ